MFERFVRNLVHEVIKEKKKDMRRKSAAKRKQIILQRKRAGR